MRNLQELVDKHGGFDAVYRLKIFNGSYQPLVVERLNSSDDPYFHVSVAHYLEMNGDLVSDPDMEFLIKREAPLEWIPLSITQLLGGTRNAATIDYDDPPKIKIRDHRLQLELYDFARMWDTNIRDQGFTESEQYILNNDRSRAPT
jgi:hypothetical protein